MALPTMTHSSAFLLPTGSSTPADAAATTYALIVLNQRLPRFAPLLWARGDASLSLSLSRFPTASLPALAPLFPGFLIGFPCFVSLTLVRACLLGTARLRLCADGGANRVFDGMLELLPDEDPAEVRKRYKPDVIKGDMDSIRPEVMEYYSNLGANIVDESHDQDTTDLHKCVSFITRNPPGPENSNLCILVLGALGGRFDHEMGNINVLYRFSEIRIILLSDDSSIFLLPKTHTHKIRIERLIEGPHCGLIPIGAPSTSTTTTGLRWNLDNTSMSYGGLVSTSNIVEEDEVTVTSDSDLIWTISIQN
ncbi:hypothetical protein PR202_ga08398 [Eleusine coracana subsp. coracana]|uniref:thiamine diphosphokinase n=1 Tax=Eleusine coracana subsp. coracana TaxID=191504 RepID=A0AAV5C238_ELECO|nr:hypothetical protein PR202_ga08398 [Eleusine coracana subsp. coracana]